MEQPSVGLAIAFSAGLLSFLSPCVLPLIPSYITFITGLGLEDVQKGRRNALIHAALFVTGFTLIFLALGAGATALGTVLRQYREWIARFGGLLVILFALYLLGVVRIGAFDRERRFHLADKPLGYFGTVIVGIAFGAGWTPCIGPILGGILTMATQESSITRGMQLLFAYSLGLAVPFLASAVALERFFDVFQRVKSRMVMITRASAVLMLAVGLIMITDSMNTLSSYLQMYTPEFLRSRL
ncbi:MAG: cytochrome c biogenesis protein CcdA [Gemmatimonadaceae bacterium]|jgi:cytochrome c-type biogenesis protein|nr:cytochrome c biogenesis protein CcdA [Gemmatimonadaceae bacterium]